MNPGSPLVGNSSNGIPSGLPLSVSVNGREFFAAKVGTGGPGALWESDGTTAGTFVVKDHNTGALAVNPSILTVANGTLFFSAQVGTSGPGGLWESDGTPAGTFMIEDFITPLSLNDLAGTLFFAAKDGTHGNQLWKSDGTSAGTTMVTDINPGGGGLGPSDLTDFDGTLYFLGDDGSGNNPPQLWITRPRPLMAVGADQLLSKCCK